jgi:phosphoribosylformylglycinamidine synthase
MLSESQERMLMVLKPGREGEAEAIFKKWELDFAVIGEVTDTGRMELVWNGETVADIPLEPLADEAPLYERPYAVPKAPEPLTDIPESTDIAADLLKLMASPNLASRRWIYEQYDQSVGGDTVQRPGGDAAVVRVHGSKKALAITTDCTPRYCYADPYEGGKQAVAEAYRNLCAVGAKPLAVTNCLNFGNPQRPEIMGQLVGCLEGMAEACRALDFPVVSGNVSLYNETKNEDGSSLAILPTPAIGGVGLLEDWEKSATIAFRAEGETIWIVGGSSPSCVVNLLNPNGTVGAAGYYESNGHLGRSLWLQEIHARSDGSPPLVDLRAERRNGEFVRSEIAQGSISSCHDISDGGMMIAVAEMVLAGSVGAQITTLDPKSEFEAAFGEDQGRYIIATSDDEFQKRALRAGVPCHFLGRTGGRGLKYDAQGAPGLSFEISLDRLRAAHEGFFPRLMGSELTPEF